MKFYFKIDANNVIRDAITFSHEGYEEVNLVETGLPAGINGGYYKWNGTGYEIDSLLKDEVDRQSAGEIGSLRDRLDQVEQDNANLLIEAMNDKMRISGLESELGNAIFEIMNLKTTTGGI